MAGIHRYQKLNLKIQLQFIFAEHGINVKFSTFIFCIKSIYLIVSFIDEAPTQHLISL